MRARGQTQLVQSSKNTDGEIKQGIHELTIRFPTSRHIRLPVAIRAATEPWWTPVGSWQEQGNEIVFGVWFVWSVWFAWSVWFSLVFRRFRRFGLFRLFHLFGSCLLFPPISLSRFFSLFSSNWLFCWFVCFFNGFEHFCCFRDMGGLGGVGWCGWSNLHQWF